MTRFRLDPKVAVITGGGSGSGATIRRACVEQGARMLRNPVVRGGREAPS